jgi:branched-chain amino acid transport system ATP-binding protein
MGKTINIREPILQIEDLSVNFGGLEALSSVTTSVAHREIRGIIGPNGAGKTTLFNIISRFYNPVRGKILFEKKNLLELKAHQIINSGISRTFQRSELFNSMSVLENVMMGSHIRTKANIFNASIQLNKVKEEERQSRKEAEEILKILSLYDYKEMPAKALPFGLQRLVEIARAISSHPKLILLDEPASGMTYTEKSNLVNILLNLREQMNLTVLIVEHDIRTIMNISDRLTVLNHGRIIVEGSPAEIRTNQMVIEAYIGKKRV